MTGTRPRRAAESSARGRASEESHGTMATKTLLATRGGRRIQFEATKPKPATASPMMVRAARQPSLSISHLARSGIKSVPNPVPDKAMPDATPRLRSNQGCTAATAGV